MEKQVKNVVDSSVKTYPKTSITKGIIITFAIFIFLSLLGILNGANASSIKRANAYAAKADLRNAATAQEAYYKDHNRYADSIDELLKMDGGWSIYDGVVIKVLSASKDNYSMLAFHKKGDIIWVNPGPYKEFERYQKSRNNGIYWLSCLIGLILIIYLSGGVN